MTQHALVHTFPAGPLATNTYVLACLETNECAIIDPGIETFFVLEPYLDERGFNPMMILLTHTHWDHIADVGPLKNHYDVPVYVHPEDAPNLEKPGVDGLPLLFPMAGIDPDFFLEEGKDLTVGNLTIQVLHTPGHSPGSVCFYLPEEYLLFSGDLVFKGSIGNLSLPTSSPQKIWPSLERVAKLPPETKIYSGHGEATSIGDEPWLSEAKKIFGSNTL